ncbi:MAG: hypothetical protein R3A10_22755 [Caldilineaceae bacterium]
MPGMAGQRTVLATTTRHDRQPAGPRGRHPRQSDLGRSDGGRAGVDGVFLVNVTLNKRKEITGVCRGIWTRPTPRAALFAKETAMVPVPAFDIVVTTQLRLPWT